MRVQAVCDSLLATARGDWVGIWEMPWLAKSVGGARDREEELQLSLQAIHHCLQEGLLDVGDVDRVFHSWNVTPAEACERIEREWREFPDGPSLGDISCWFKLTTKGRQLVEDRGLMVTDEDVFGKE